MKSLPTTRREIAAALALLTAAVPSEGQIQARPEGGTMATCRARIEAFRLAHPGGAPGPTGVIDDKDLNTFFPGFCFGTVRYRTGLMRAPKSLDPHNLVVVTPEGRAERLATKEDLDRFFKADLKGAKDEHAARAAANAWLRLARELSQRDGGYITFDPDQTAVRVSSEGQGLRAKGRMVAGPGASGLLDVDLTIGPDGRVAKIESSVTAVSRGERPR